MFSVITSYKKIRCYIYNYGNKNEPHIKKLKRKQMERKENEKH